MPRRWKQMHERLVAMVDVTGQFGRTVRPAAPDEPSQVREFGGSGGGPATASRKLMPVGQQIEDTETTRSDAETMSGVRVSESLLVVVGSTHFSTHMLTSEPIVIGRAADCDLVLEHRSLSRRHAVLRCTPELSVQDLGSMNGVRLEGQVVRGGSAVPLSPGDSFHIGPFSFLIVHRPTGQSTDRSGRERLIVNDPTPGGVSTLVREIAKSDVNVLVLGETGVGKEVLANTIHALSDRPGQLASINCAALSDRDFGQIRWPRIRSIEPLPRGGRRLDGEAQPAVVAL
jgi:pSer/pThr/pTyr-binding forkhead associated (FHA) protein